MPPATAISPTLKRKKWTEEEERSLIAKYSEMQSDGILSRMRTREKKFRPIASHVNAGHHSIDSAAYPFLWSWKDASTKVQNMRHQYLLVKQKLLSSSADEQLDWSQGVSLWPNFLIYRDVFGDAPLPLKPQDPSPDHLANGDPGLGLGFECSDEVGGFEREEAPPPKKKKRRRREWARVSAAIREREERLEEREREWEARKGEEVERMRRMEEEEREWEERMERRHGEWRERMDGMMERHRAEMEQMQARVLQEQQAVVNQLIGIVSHWGSGIGDVGGMGGGSGGGGGGQNYMSQMSGMVPGENRVGGDGQDDLFIVGEE